MGAGWGAVVGLGAGVVVAVLAGVGDAGDGMEGVLGDLDVHGDLLAGFVPQDFQANAANRRALRVGGRPRMSPVSGSWSGRAGSAAAGVVLARP
jgi:hypothetical protein